MYRVISLMALFAWLGLTGVSAWAIDVTGTWVGTQVCQYFDGQGQILRFPDDVMAISQRDTDLYFFTPLVGGIFHGRVIEDANHPSTKAQATFLACDTTDANPYWELGRATKLQVISHGRKARFLATSNFVQIDPDGYRFMGTCNWIYHRVDRSDPGVGECTNDSVSAGGSAGLKGRPRPNPRSGPQ